MSLRELGARITRSSFRFAMDRFGAEQRTLDDASRQLSPWVSPVVSVGEDFSDRERPLWSTRCFANNVSGQYGTCSLTSAFDVAVYELRITSDSPRDEEFFILTPPASWVPFENNAAAFGPGIRPRIAFDAGNTICIAGTNPLPAPFAGIGVTQRGGYGQNRGNPINPQTISYVDGVTGLLFTYVRHFNGESGGPFWYRQDEVVRFARPLILPTPLFLTVAHSERNRDLAVSFTYSELGGGALI